MAYKMKGNPKDDGSIEGTEANLRLRPKTKGTLTTTTEGDKKTYHIGEKEVTKEEYDAHKENIKPKK